ARDRARRAGRAGAPSARGRDQGRDLHRPCGRKTSRRLARAVCRRRLREEGMDLTTLERRSDHEWWIPQHGAMRVPGVIYASEALVREMDEKVREQIINVATL